jgi:tRNA A37 threonylcarbamoyladenosine modification protein TsaB
MVAVDAGRGAYYVQSFAAGAVATGEPLLLTAQETARSVGRRGAVVIVGTGAQTVAGLANAAGGNAEARFPDLQPHAGSLARLAPRLTPTAPVRPLYLRPPDARAQDPSPARTPP